MESTVNREIAHREPIVDEETRLRQQADQLYENRAFHVEFDEFDKVATSVITNKHKVLTSILHKVGLWLEQNSGMVNDGNYIEIPALIVTDQEFDHLRFTPIKTKSYIVKLWIIDEERDYMSTRVTKHNTKLVLVPRRPPKALPPARSPLQIQ